LDLPNRTFRLGDWLVEPHLNRISRRGTSRLLRPQVMDLLVYLAGRPNQVVATDDLLDEVWAGVIVSSGSVYNCVNELRRALDDDPQLPAYIETISKRGYRLIAAVEFEGEKPGADDRRTAASRLRPARWAVLVLVIAGVLALLLAGRSRDIAPGAGQVQSIAVLPFQDFSPEPTPGWPQSVTASLITELSRFGALRVISHASVQAYAERQLSVSELARRLSVDAVLDGSLTREGDLVLLNARLLRAPDEGTLWSGTVQSEIRNMLDLQRHLAAEVAGEVGAMMNSGQLRERPAPSLVDPKAYDAMVLGEHLLRQGNAQPALDSLRRAVEIDQDFALGWAVLGQAYLHYSIDDPTWVEAARTAANRALGLDPDLVIARTTLAGIALYRNWDWPTARSELEAALLLNPGYDEAHQILGDYYEFVGDWDRAIAEGIRSTRVSPDNVSMLLNLGITYIFARRYPEAEETCLQALGLRPESSFGHRCLAEARAGMGDLAGGLEYLEEAARLAPDNQPLLAQQAIFFMASGQAERARAVIGVLDRLEREGAYVSPLIRAMVHMALGEHERALDLIGTAIDEKAPWTPGIQAWPYFDPLRGHERFEALVHKVRIEG